MFWTTRQAPLTEYNSYNESHRLSERYMEFNVVELKRTVMQAVDRCEADIQSFRKLAEGGFNRTFEITMKDGLQTIARLPYPSTLPKRYAVASEVATMDLIRSYGLPVPRIYGYSTTPNNPIGSEYIIMEKTVGKEVGHAWYDLSVKERKSITLEVTKLEAILFSISLPAFGSVYYKHDLAATDQSIDIPAHDGLCIGPDVALGWWYDPRDTLSIDRGPCEFILVHMSDLLTVPSVVDPGQLMQAGARKELTWARRFGRTRFPFSRHHREFLSYRKSSPDEHIKHLEMYLRLSSHLIPKSQSLLRPTIRHPDLQPHNIFVSDDFEIVGLIDWQHCSILPLFLQAGVPKYWQNPSDEPVVVEKPGLPPNYEQLSEAEYRQRQLHLLYLGYTTRLNPSHMDAYLTKGLSFKRRIFEHASAPWEGDNTTLKADLILAVQNWEELTRSDDHEQSPVCPISFPKEEVEECLRVDLLLKEVDAQMEIVRESIGIGSDGWVPTEEYDGAVEKNKFIRQEVIDRAENDVERRLSLTHYPFDDHNEDE
jgi:aminoglycoside phosphotransferase (APT) family kinase protein